ncbi:hypothetical protein LINPERHAP1_LOCUS12452 [Linum perenne]
MDHHHHNHSSPQIQHIRASLRQPNTAKIRLTKIPILSSPSVASPADTTIASPPCAASAMFGGGGGGSVYWGRRGRKSNGIVVIFAWVSVNPADLRSLVELYSSLGWNPLVCHADFLTAFYPERAMSLAFLLLSELVQEIRIRPCPVVFVALSGGSKACMFKVFQIIQGSCEGHLNLDESRLVGNCFSGHIYDSSPVDFTSDWAVRSALPSIQKMPGPSKLMSWFTRGVTSGLDGLYLTRFEHQRTQYWQTLYSSVELGAPYLILYSTNDELVPCDVINGFGHQLQVLGADVALVKWNASPHLGLSLQTSSSPVHHCRNHSSREGHISLSPKNAATRRRIKNEWHACSNIRLSMRPPERSS